METSVASLSSAGSSSRTMAALIASEFMIGLSEIPANTCPLNDMILTSPLELIAGPQRPVVEVAGWLTFLNECPRVEDSVVGLKPEVTIRLPVHLHAWT